MADDARTAGIRVPVPSADERLILPSPSPAATVAGITAAILRRVAPGLLVRIAGRTADRALPRFTDLLRIVELAGALPATDETGSPAGVLDRFPHLANVATSDVVIDGPNGPVLARTYRPPDPTGVGLAWVHGGAFIGGDLDRADAHWPSLELAYRGVTVVSLDYRHAVRGVHFPVPSDDVLAGWRWAASHATALGVSSAALHLGGSSIGGNLAAGVAKRVRDARPAEPAPASLVLVAPLLHPFGTPVPADVLARMRAATGGTVFRPDDLTHMAWNYAGRRSVLDDPYAFPANGELAGLPPTLVITEEFDTIRTSGEDFAARLRAEGVPAVVRMTPGAAHSSLGRPSEPTAGLTIDVIADHLLGPWTPRA